VGAENVWTDARVALSTRLLMAKCLWFAKEPRRALTQLVALTADATTAGLAPDSLLMCEAWLYTAQLCLELGEGTTGLQACRSVLQWRNEDTSADAFDRAEVTDIICALHLTACTCGLVCCSCGAKRLAREAMQACVRAGEEWKTRGKNGHAKHLRLQVCHTQNTRCSTLSAR
jgi:hypothetical protein